MSNVLDNILKDQILDSPEIATDGWVSPKKLIDNIEAGFSLAVETSGISGTSFIQIQFSNTGEDGTFATDEESIIERTTDGTLLYDIGKTEVSWIRILITGNGDPTVEQVLFVAGRRH